MEIFQRKSTKQIAAADGRATVSRTEANVAVIHLFGHRDWTGFCRSEDGNAAAAAAAAAAVAIVKALSTSVCLYIYLSDTRHNSLKVSGGTRL